MIEKSICLPGNIFVVNSKVSVDNDHMNWGKNKSENGLNAYYTDNKQHGVFEVPIGSKIEIVQLKTSAVYFKYENILYQSWWNGFRVKVDKIEGQEIKEPTKEVIRYKIYKDGKAYKPKYFNDLGKIKSSLLIAIGYYNNQYRMFEQYKDRNPELQDNQISEWFSNGDDIKREDCGSFEIMSFAGKSRTPVKTDFNVLEYYDQSMRLINVTAQFGSAARELFKKCMETKEYSYMLIYSPDEYRDKSYVNRYEFDFSALKENQKIKDVMKASGVKDSKKCTKFGKTAIVFKNVDDLKQVMLRLEPKEYFILDCDGEQLIEKNTRFVKLIMLQKVADEQEE